VCWHHHPWNGCCGPGWYAPPNTLSWQSAPFPSADPRERVRMLEEYVAQLERELEAAKKNLSLLKGGAD